MTCNTGHMICDMWQKELGEHSLNIFGPCLLWFGIKDVLNILRKRMSDWMKYNGACRKASAPLGLLIVNTVFSTIWRIGDN